MAYTIALQEILSPWSLQELNKILHLAVDQDGRFKIGQTEVIVPPQKGTIAGKPLARLGEIRWKMIRLTSKKEYCGQHPGECLVNPFFGPQKKKKGVWLEWEDWVAFHGLINSSLDRQPVRTQVYTRPQDAGGKKFYIRKDGLPRIRFDWEESFDGGQRLQVWNLGTSDQF